MTTSKYQSIMNDVHNHIEVYVEEESFSDDSKGFNLVIKGDENLCRIACDLETAREIGHLITDKSAHITFE